MPKKMTYAEGNSLVHKGALTPEGLAHMIEAGLVEHDPLEVRSEAVAEEYRAEFRALLEAAEALSAKLADKHIRVQVAKVK